MKWRMVVVFFFVVLICLSGCDARALSEEEIKDDIVAKEELDRSDATITDYSVIKRQTNIEDKNDIIYMTISGENDDYAFVKNYVATYCLYNEGWQLEELIPYYDIENGIKDSIVPKHGVENPKDYLEFVYSASGEEQVAWASWPNSVNSTQASELQHVKTTLGREDSVDLYCLTMTYYYSALVEKVEIPIAFYFNTNLSGNAWSWTMYIETNSAVRTLTLSDGIIGWWTSHYTGGKQLADNIIANSNRYFQNWGADVYISSHTDDTCEVDSYTRVYSNAEYTTSGTMRLSYSINDETGKIKMVRLQWVGDVPDSTYCGNLWFSTYLGIDYLEVDDYSLANCGGSSSAESTDRYAKTAGDSMTSQPATGTISGVYVLDAGENARGGSISFCSDGTLKLAVPFNEAYADFGGTYTIDDDGNISCTMNKRDAASVFLLALRVNGTSMTACNDYSTLEMGSVLSYAGEFTPLDGEGTVTGDDVRIRTGPGTDYGVITTLNKGDTVAISGMCGNWYRVTYTRLSFYSELYGGTVSYVDVGFMSADYVSR